MNWPCRNTQLMDFLLKSITDNESVENYMEIEFVGEVHQSSPSLLFSLTGIIFNDV